MVITSTNRGERLLIYRLREKETQLQAAERYGVCRDIYYSWESGARTHDQPDIRIGELTDSEACLLARKRKGLSQEAVGKAIGVTRQWVNRMETGTENPQTLMNYWAGIL